ncbi:hypothetical protein [Devosia sp. 1635]|uniref:hypothetical protein n=1 Tax=Devosia sp. 1635 TaxID=2726066 RepID=UPI001566CEB1|nr:hypothetical protein [Devosia sp. 1635]
MQRFIIAVLAVVMSIAPAMGQYEGDVYTLYRNSVTDATMRIHVATFDSVDGKDYNYENCTGAADLFQGQDSVQVRFWCEPGRFRK